MFQHLQILVLAQRPEAAAVSRPQTAIFLHVRDFQSKDECMSWLSQARNYIQAGSYDRAREMLMKVIETHPATSFADQAQAELAGLP